MNKIDINNIIERINILEEQVNNINSSIRSLKEKYDLLYNKDYINNHVKEQGRLLNAQYGKLLKNLKEELNQYNFKGQIGVKKILLSKIPENDMEISEYIDKVSKVLKTYNLRYNLLEYEIWLNKIGFIKNNKINKNNISKYDFDLLMKAYE